MAEDRPADIGNTWTTKITVQLYHNLDKINKLFNCHKKFQLFSTTITKNNNFICHQTFRYQQFVTSFNIFLPLHPRFSGSRQLNKQSSGRRWNIECTVHCEWCCTVYSLYCPHHSRHQTSSYASDKAPQTEHLRTNHFRPNPLESDLIP